MRAWEDLTADELAVIRARLLRAFDPQAVAESRRRHEAWVATLGHPKRCKTNQVHPGLGCCLACGADSGENCRLPSAARAA